MNLKQYSFVLVNFVTISSKEKQEILKKQNKYVCDICHGICDVGKSFGGFGKVSPTLSCDIST